MTCSGFRSDLVGALEGERHVGVVGEDGVVVVVGVAVRGGASWRGAAVVFQRDFVGSLGTRGR